MPEVKTGIEYLDVYHEALEHQRHHDSPLMRSWPRREEQPNWSCFGCLKERRDTDVMGRDVRRRYSFAVPNEQALTTIATHSLGGVVEIGAGGGYWAMLLQQRGVDVLPFDPRPVDSEWHDGSWTAVHVGDHTVAAEHPIRTLLLCWPSYGESWAAQAVEVYGGDTVIYIGEGCGGCTADDRFHALVGEEPYCWHHDDEYRELPCPDDCPSKVVSQFAETETVAIPQWFGIHDRLTVYRRVAALVV